MKHKKSIIRQRPGTCFICCLEGNDRQHRYLETHHIFFGTANRRKSEAEGLTVRLCQRHHEAVHRNAKLCRRLQAYAQKVWESYPEHSRAEWMKIFHRNYREDML
ncbi:MAG: hypothetical protein J6O73_15995 [Lachnospiraceae bacterium]|nr:hypothetical protein [Lachnospiraceae bacterium]